ncbi:hypothetical protein LCGC14_2703990, partial [marine sediment metagenome]
VNFIVAMNFLSNTLQEHKYGENILKIIGDSNNSKLSPIELNNGNTIDPKQYQEQRTDIENGFVVKDILKGTLGNLILYNTTRTSTLEIEIYNSQTQPELLLLKGELLKDKYLIYTTSINFFDVKIIVKGSHEEFFRITKTLRRKPYKIYYETKLLVGGFGIPILKIEEIEMPKIEQTVQFINNTGKILYFRVKTNKSEKKKSDIIYPPTLLEQQISINLPLRSSLFLFPLSVSVVTDEIRNIKEVTKLMDKKKASKSERIEFLVHNNYKTITIHYIFGKLDFDVTLRREKDQINNKFIDASFLDIFRRLPGNMHLYFLEFAKKRKTLEGIYDELDLNVSNLIVSIMENIKDRKDKIEVLAKMHATFLTELKKTINQEQPRIKKDFQQIMTDYQNFFRRLSTNSNIELKNIERINNLDGDKINKLEEKIKKGILF